MFATVDRRKFIKKSLGVLSLVALGSGSLLEAAADASKLVILHTNDMHSRIEPFADDGRQWGGMGGMARRAALVEAVRSQEKNVLLLDAGDVFQGTPYFNLFGGKLEFELMSQMGYDAGTLGNHDFDNGLDGLSNVLPHACFPILCANYDFSDTVLKNRFEPYRIFNKSGLKIGVFGLGIDPYGLIPENLFGQTHYMPAVPAAQKCIDALKKAGCHYIICLSHLGYEHSRPDKLSDIGLASQTHGLHLIIGGHTHTFLDKPMEVKDLKSDIVQIVQAGWAGIRLGRIDIEFDYKNRPKTTQAALLPIVPKLES